jgi:hypothetical protein
MQRNVTWKREDEEETDDGKEEGRRYRKLTRPSDGKQAALRMTSLRPWSEEADVGSNSPSGASQVCM